MIRARVCRELERAFGPPRNIDGLFEPVDIEGEPEPVECITTANAFKLIFTHFRVDTTDQFVQEKWAQLAREELERMLRRTFTTEELKHTIRRRRKAI